ncbi:hypothetical protein DSO57_1021144 [Entomophthora muscae]|uniref:Uncharacterized protein n=1 Tax=Entomophthora muscae TaxID=34485 RepID=A0ACC2RUP1_9FUNG|nr:hypothetical protein DSO57_1021144 [Entomophthora muscae]
MLPMTQFSYNSKGHASTGMSQLKANYSFDPTWDPKIGKKETNYMGHTLIKQIHNTQSTYLSNLNCAVQMVGRPPRPRERRPRGQPKGNNQVGKTQPRPSGGMETPNKKKSPPQTRRGRHDQNPTPRKKKKGPTTNRPRGPEIPDNQKKPEAIIPAGKLGTRHPLYLLKTGMHKNAGDKYTYTAGAKNPDPRAGKRSTSPPPRRHPLLMLDQEIFLPPRPPPGVPLPKNSHQPDHTPP